MSPAPKTMINCIVPEELLHESDIAESYLTSDLYPIYRDIVAEAKPKSILEIGCRYGYSLGVALDAYDGIERAVAVDIVDDPSAYIPGPDGAFRTTQRNVQAMKRSGRWPGTQFEFYEQNTQRVTDLPFSGSFDLVYVDGDHTVAGMLHDLMLVIPLLSEKGIIVVDDMDWMPELSAPAKLFARAVGMDTAYHPDESGRGRLVMSGYKIRNS